MGKIKRERQKYHIAVKPNNVEPELQKATPIKFQFDSVENIFAGINIKLSDINKLEEASTIPIQIEEEKNDVQREYQTFSKISNTQEKLKILTKKEKMARKHQKLIEKLDVTQQARLRSRKRKQKDRMNIDETLLHLSQSDAHSLSAPIAENHEHEKSNRHALKTPFNDGLPAINSLGVEKDNFRIRIQAKSKLISKKGENKKNFVRNYNFLKKAMTKKIN